MTLANELAQLRTNHGEKAIEAYQAIANTLLNSRDTAPFLVRLGGFFHLYGFEATCAALKLHTERARGIVSRVHETKAPL